MIGVKTDAQNSEVEDFQEAPILHRTLLRAGTSVSFWCPPQVPSGSAVLEFDDGGSRERLQLRMQLWAFTAEDAAGTIEALVPARIQCGLRRPSEWALVCPDGFHFWITVENVNQKVATLPHSCSVGACCL